MIANNNNNNNVISNIFIIITIIILIIINNFTNADDISCLSSLLNKAFNSNLKVSICTNNFNYDPDGVYMYKAECDSSNSNITKLILSASSSFTNSPIEYQDLSCFSDNLNEIFLTFITIKKDAIGVLGQKRVANNILLYSCYFQDQLLISQDKELPIDTSYLKIYSYNFNTNLKEVSFKSLKNLKYLYIEIFSNEFPNIINNLQSDDVTDISELSIVSNKIPSFNNVRCKRLELSLVGNMEAISLLNLATLTHVNNLKFGYDGTIEYPIELSSSNNKLKSLTIAGKLKAPSSISNYQLLLPDGLTFFHISQASPDFNINGRFPFNQLPNSLESLFINNLGLTEFPSNLPTSLSTLSIVSNKFNINLPDFSNVPNLRTIALEDCGLIGTIPESYCLFNVMLNNNFLSGYLPQCKICYIDSFKSHFINNSLLNYGVCESGSVVPNLYYNESAKEFVLYGQNLGLGIPISSAYNLGFFTVTRQSLFRALWLSSSPIPSTLSITIGPRNFTLATENLTPLLSKITKLDKQFTFEGSNYSYNKSDFEIKISKQVCTIQYLEFNKIICSVSNVLPINQDVPSTIRNTKSNLTTIFTVNTLVDKTTIVMQCSNICQYGVCSSTLGSCICDDGYFGNTCSEKRCSFDCGFSEGRGSCSGLTGKCVCNQRYSGDDCSIPTPFLTSVSSTLTSGGVVNLYGWFSSDQYSTLKVGIGNLDCKVHFVNSTFSNCTIGSGTGTLSVLITINSYTWTGFNMFHYIPQEFGCPKDCSSNGECNKSTGQCLCFIGWAGFDCNSKDSSGSTTTPTTSGQTPKPDDSIPSSNTTIDDDSGSTIITNQETTYEISIISLVELDVNGQEVVVHNLTNKWISNSTVSNNIHKFKQEIQGTTTTTTTTTSCLITYTIEDIKEPRDYEFAGLKLTLDKDSIKITVSIENYPFTNVLNNLQLRIESSVDQNGSSDNQCNYKDTDIDTQQLDKNQLLNYVTISRNQKILYGRFLNRVLSDNRESFITTSLISNSTANISKRTKDSIVIGLNLPHFTSSLIIDPDFSVLVSSEFKKCKSNERDSWVLPVAIVVPCVALFIIVIVASIIYVKNRSTVLVIKDKLKLKSLSKRKKDELYMPNDPTRT